jgi:hypothetical protein
MLDLVGGEHLEEVLLLVALRDGYKESLLD